MTSAIKTHKGFCLKTVYNIVKNSTFTIRIYLLCHYLFLGGLTALVRIAPVQSLGINRPGWCFVTVLKIPIFHLGWSYLISQLIMKQVYRLSFVTLVAIPIPIVSLFCTVLAISDLKAFVVGMSIPFFCLPC